MQAANIYCLIGLAAERPLDLYMRRSQLVRL